MDYRSMRRSDRALSKNDTIRIIRSSDYGVLSLCANGIPYGVPLSPAYDKDKHKLYFHCAWEGYKLDILKKNDAAHFLFVNRAINLPETASVDYESAMVFGRCYLVEDEDERQRAFDLICQRYMAGYDDAIQKHMKVAERAAIIGFDINHISGKHNQ